jgi:hypothetical protein
MTRFPLPYPSWRCRGIVWSLPRCAVAIVPSGFLANALIVGFALFLVVLSAVPKLALVVPNAVWWATLGVLALANIAMTSIVTVRSDGVRVRRIVLAFVRVDPVARGGTFRGADPDEFDFDDDDGSLASEVTYESGDLWVAIDCFRPSALAAWLGAEAARLVARHPLPTATAIARRRAPLGRGAVLRRSRRRPSR